MTGITDLDLRVAESGALVLYATSRSGMTISEYTISGNVTFTGFTALPTDIADVGFITSGGSNFAFGLGPGLVDPVLWDVTSDGGFTSPDSLASGTSTAFGFAAATTIEVSGNSYFYGAGYSDADLYSYRVDPSGTMTPVTGNTFPAGASRLFALEIDGAPLLLSTSSEGRSIESHSIDSNGLLSFSDSVGALDGLGIAGVTDLVHVAQADGDYIVVAARDSSSLSVLSIDSAGAMTPVDHIIDDLNSRFQNVTALAGLSVGDRHFIAAGGLDDGVSIFEMLPGGRLLQVETFVDTSDAALNNVSALSMAEIGGVLHLFAGSGDEEGISHFTATTPSAPTQTGGAGNDLITGSSSGEILAGGAGNDTIRGEAGDDIVIDGAGSDELTGGSGRDIFVLVDDNLSDTITDFTLNEDQLDLSGWTFFRNPSQLTYTATDTGATLAFFGESVTLISSDGQTLEEAALLTQALLNVSRIPLGDVTATEIIGTNAAETLTGTEADNRIEGKGGDDALLGGLGNDILLGGSGQDTLDGGGGFDTVSYQDATSDLTADLAFDNNNSGAATGDEFVRLEHLEGSNFRDNLRGSEGGNVLRGLAGNDTVFGRGGNDSINGGEDDDILLGDAGADFLNGGAGTDRAAYWTAGSGVIADLLVAQVNTGDAAGDVFNGIENLQGSNFDDDLRGDGLSNVLWGNNGNDILHGRQGEDTLFGGDGDDILLSGAGTDVLDGGAGRDRAAYWTAPGRITADLAFSQFGTGEAAGDTYSGIEDLQGTGFGDDLRGDASNNRIWGGNGGDILYGRAGNDVLFGQNGDDRLLGGAGADTLDGGAGIDRAAYWTASGGLVADLAFSTSNTGEAAGDTFTSIEDLQGTNFSDDLRGTAGDNRIWGGGGNDVLHGRGGVDGLFGEAGDDILLSGGGGGTLDGGAGNDRAAYWTSPIAITASLANPGLNTGHAFGDAYVSIENLQGSNFGDRLLGDAGDNEIFGNNGDDEIDGGSGGADVLTGGAGADYFVFRGGSDTIADFQDGIDRFAIDSAVSGALTASQIVALETGQNGDAVLDFGSGDRLVFEGMAPGALDASDFDLI
ncbi:MAG: hypothetical protein AAFY68_00830 [Pseudomonadota bacterium]